VAAPALGPVTVVILRVALAGSALAAYAAVTGREVAWRPRWRAFLVLGALNATIPYALIATAELHLTASLAAILNATAPFFTAVVAAVWLGERIGPRTAIGMVVGLIGVAAVVGWSPLPVDWRLLASVGASLTAALSYELVGVYAKRTFAGTPPLTLALGQQVGAMLLLLPLVGPLTMAGKTNFKPSAGVVASVVALALLCTAVGYLLYFFLIGSVGPTKTLSVTFLMPPFGVVWSALFSGEAVRPSTVAGLGVILVGVYLVMRGQAEDRGQAKSRSRSIETPGRAIGATAPDR
jgi:drug/metabolite transporter (DMT)-like permease